MCKMSLVPQSFSSQNNLNNFYWRLYMLMNLKISQPQKTQVTGVLMVGYSEPDVVVYTFNLSTRRRQAISVSSSQSGLHKTTRANKWDPVKKQSSTSWLSGKPPCIKVPWILAVRIVSSTWFQYRYCVTILNCT